MAMPSSHGDAHPSTCAPPKQPSRVTELRAIFACIPDKPLLARLRAYRPAAGRPSYSVRAMWHAYLASFVLNLGGDNSLIRELRNDPHLRRACGFRDRLPCRTTFNRFRMRLALHWDLVEAALAGAVDEAKALLPDLGEVVAIDGTMVQSYSDPRRDTDPEAGWGVTHSSRSRSRENKGLVFGYKLQTMADTKYNLPLAVTITTGSRHDSPELPPLVDKARGMYDWFAPKVAVADRGYDAASNHQELVDRGIIPVIHMRKPSSRTNGLHKGLYTATGEPTCIGGVAMEYVGANKAGLRKYQCRAEGCPLKDKAGISYCGDEYILDPNEDIRLFGVIRRGSKRWKQYYRQRMAVERCFKSLKQSRRLERHCHRGLRAVRLHALMSVLTLVATVLANIKAGRRDHMNWMVPQVA